MPWVCVVCQRAAECQRLSLVATGSLCMLISHQCWSSISTYYSRSWRVTSIDLSVVATACTPLLDVSNATPSCFVFANHRPPYGINSSNLCPSEPKQLHNSPHTTFCLLLQHFGHLILPPPPPIHLGICYLNKLLALKWLACLLTH